jgi:putative heme-binding domain-containing protein
VNPFHRARAIWLLAELGSDGVREVERRLSDPDPQIRVTAFRALRKVKGAMLAGARRLAQDPSPAVRREVAVALRGTPFEDSRDVFLALAERLDPRDRWSLEAIGTGASGNEAALYAALTAAPAANRPLQWDERVAALAWRLHPVEALDAFAARAASAELPPGARRQALAAIGFIDHPRAAQVMAQLTESPLDDVSAQAAWWMTYRKANDWYAYPVDGWIAGPSGASPGPPGEMLDRRVVVLDQAAPIDRRIESALVMAADPAGARLLLQLAAGNRLVYQLREAVGSVIFTNPDRAVRAAAAGFFNAPGGRPRMTVDGVSARTGDAGRGAARFARSCSTCHRVGLESAGAEVGPDLSNIHSKLDRRGLIEAVVNPGAGIALGFEAELFLTRSGESHIGFLQSDAATLAIRDGDGVVRTIRRDELEARVPLKSSLMPGPLALALSEQDVADIVAYLEKLPTHRGADPR